jgi:putative addiction module killer protein
MEPQPRRLEIYAIDDDDTPFLSWLEDLRDRKAIAIIKKRLDRVAMGNLGDYQSVGGGVFEFRIDYGAGYRVYFAPIEKVVLLLLCGGDKSTQDQDIAKAKKFLTDFNKRKNANY